MTATPESSPLDPARWDFELAVDAGLVRLLVRLEEMEDLGGFGDGASTDQFPFLVETRRRLVDRTGGDADVAFDPDHWDALSEQLAAATAHPLPLHALAAAPWAGPDARAVVGAVALVEQDIRLGAIFATMQAPLNHRRPCVGLLGWLLGAGTVEVAAACDRLEAAGVLTVENPDDPRAEHVVRLPAPILAAVQGAPIRKAGIEVRSVSDAPALDDLVLPEELRARLERLGRLLARGDCDVVVARGMTGSGRRTILHAVAAASGRGLLLAEKPGDDAGGLGALALLTGSMLVHVVEPGLGEVVELPTPPAGVTPVGVVSGRTGGVRIGGLDRTLLLDVPPPDQAGRRRLWERAGLTATPGVLDEVSARFALTGGHIGRVAKTAAAVAALAGRDTVVVADVREAARSLGRQALETLTTLLPPIGESLSPVLSGETQDEFEALVLRCRRREAIVAAAAPALTATLNRGVRAMFSGPSGTGKTLAARALGTRLDLDVYRVDLAAVVDKYIGETERRLNEVFGRAEELDVILLLDEGDALMARRTDVRNANDRYANLETNYLLQRLETYEGIIVVTTNAAAVVDTAFLRRLDVVINFASPDTEERREIWRRHLPDPLGVDPELMELVVRRCQLTGAQIRNAALQAALVALDADAAVGDAALREAVAREYRRAGLTSPLAGGAGAASSPLEAALATARRG